MTAQPQAAHDGIVVFAHVHYPEIWRGMANWLAAHVNVPFRLVATTAHPPAEVAAPRSSFLQDFRVLPVENRGRDILPFLHALADEPPFAIGLKLHTKKSPQRADGRRWRTALLESLVPAGFEPGGMPSPGTGTAAILRRMAKDERIGLVAPAGFSLNVRAWILVNRPGMERVTAATGGPLLETDLDDAFFAAGSMFWFRRAALLPLAAPAVLSAFEPEEGQFDGTAAHAAERLFPVIAKRAGFLSMAMPALEASRPGQDRAVLLDMARRHADIPNLYFPRPGQAVASIPVSAG